MTVLQFLTRHTGYYARREIAGAAGITEAEAADALAEHLANGTIESREYAQQVGPTSRGAPTTQYRLVK